MDLFGLVLLDERAVHVEDGTERVVQRRCEREFLEPVVRN
jgi:hypothetical protein